MTNWDARVETILSPLPPHQYNASSCHPVIVNNDYGMDIIFAKNLAMDPRQEMQNNRISKKYKQK